MTPATIDLLLLGPDDASVLEHVHDDVFDHPVDPVLARTFLASPHHLIVVARDGGTVVGMASGVLYLHPDKPLQLFANEVGVAGPWQRQGLGRRLVSHLLEEARARGCTEAWVATEGDNTAARALYRSTGGEEDPERPVVYSWTLEAPGRKHNPD